MKRSFTARRSPGIPRLVLSLGAAVLLTGAVVAVVVGGSSADAATADVACGRSATASSNSSTASRANDCTAGTTWQSTTSKPQQWQVDLGASTLVDHVTITWGAGYATSYKIRSSADGTGWHTETSNTNGHGGTETLTLPANTTTRWIQVYLSQYTGTAGFTIDEVAVYATPATTPPTPTPTHTTTPTPSPTPTGGGGGHTWNVTNAAGLSAALAAVAPGDTIALASGRYDGAFYATTSGTSSRPITLTGPRGAVLSNSTAGCDPNVPSAPSGITYCGYGLHLNGVSYWHLTGFSVSGAAKGIVLDRSSNNTLDSVEVSTIDQEGVHFRTDSSNNLIQRSSIHDTGVTDHGIGEGLYFGSAQSNWPKYGEDGGTGQDHSNNNQAIANTFGPRIGAEHIDIKEGTTGGLVQGNTFIGAVSGDNSADSWVDVKGSGYTLIGNHGSYTVGVPADGYQVLADGYQVHQIVSPYGCGNVFRSNDSNLGGVGGYAVNVTDQSHCSSANVVYSSNTVTNAKSGLTNIAVTAG
jgi:F5/8 type C domain